VVLAEKWLALTADLRVHGDELRVVPERRRALGAAGRVAVAS
jgi:hypothetical protein